MNHTFIHRYDLDRSRPSVGSALRDAALRVLVPTIVVFAVIVGLGYLITGPLGDLKSENTVNSTLAAGRTSLWNSITAVWSHIGNTEIVIGVCLVAVAVDLVAHEGVVVCRHAPSRDRGPGERLRRRHRRRRP